MPVGIQDRRPGCIDVSHQFGATGVVIRMVPLCECKIADTEVPLTLGASPQTGLRDRWECRDRHRMDRDFLATLFLSHADFSEPHSSRFAIRHRFYCHAVNP